MLSSFNNTYYTFRKRNGLKHELLRNEETIAETRIEVSFIGIRYIYSAEHCHKQNITNFLKYIFTLGLNLFILYSLLMTMTAISYDSLIQLSVHQ